MKTMARESLRQLVRSLGKFGGSSSGTHSDAALLERFAVSRDEAAFELLLWRHGPMVLGVCRRLLSDPQDAEDAFQTTFLALVRKAGSIASGNALSGWLFQVAYRSALRLRMARARRAARQQPGLDQLVASPVDDTNGHELRKVLDDEIDRLPARQRLAFVLCCLEGKTGAEAARLIGCRPGTVSSRLTRARERLRSRLLRRGLAPAAALVAGLGQEALAAPLPPALVGTALKLVVGVPSPEMLSHVEGVLRAMFLSKLKTTTLLLATLGILIVGGVLTHHALQAQPPGPDGLEAPPAQVVQEKAGPKGADGALPVVVVKPQQGPLDRTTQQSCGVLPFDQAAVFAAVPGALKSVAVDLGDRVKKGQVLATIDAPLLVLEYKLAAAAVQQAKGQVREGEAGRSVARAEFDAARSFTAQRKAELESAEATLVFHNKQLERIKDLYKLNSIDTRLLDEANHKVMATKTQVAGANAAVTTARADEVVKQNKVAQAEAVLETIRARVVGAEITLEKAQYTQSLTTICSPVDGVITGTNLRNGDYLRSGEPGGNLPLLTIQRTDLVRVVVEIRERDVPATEAGAPVELRFDALPGIRFKGHKLARIGFAVNAKTHTMRVEVDVPNPEQRLRPGMYGVATVHLQKGPAQALRVPAGSVFMHAGEEAVYVVRGGKAHRIPVGVGYSNGRETEILSGLQPEDLVATNLVGLTEGIVPVEVKQGAAPK